MNYIIKNNIYEKKIRTEFIWNSNLSKFISNLSCTGGTSFETIENENIFIEAKNNIDNNLINFDVTDWYNRFNIEVENITYEEISNIEQILSCIGQIRRLDIIVVFEKKIKAIINQNSFTIKDNVKLTLNLIAIIKLKNEEIILKKEKIIMQYDNGKLYNSLLDLANEVTFPYKTIIDNTCYDLTGKTKDIDILLPSGLSGIFIHEAIGHSLEGDTFFEDDSFFKNKLYKRITNNNNIIIKDLYNYQGGICEDYSDDGSKCENVTLVENGILTGVMTNQIISKKYKVLNTGNGRRANYYDFSLPRMRNTLLEPGNHNVSEIYDNVNFGLIALDINGGNVNINNGNFVFQISQGVIIQNGEIVKIAKPYLFIGNISNALDSIVKIGCDIKFNNAICGKKGQYIDVSYGAPTIQISYQ